MASILVIDDDRAVLATIKVLLERAAHTLEAVDNSRDGLHLVASRSFDLLIVDIFMPGMDGFETMRLVHQSRPDNAGHRDFRTTVQFRIGPAARLSAHGNQVGRRLKFAKTVQTDPAAGCGR